MITLTCFNCGYTTYYSVKDYKTDGLGTYCICHKCHIELCISSEPRTTNQLIKNQTPAIQVLNKGSVVQIDNQQHPWHNEIAIVIGYCWPFYKVEFRNQQVKVPQHWITSYEPNNTNG